MKLYFSPGACSMAPHIVLSECGLKFDIERVDMKTKQTTGGADFMKMNSKGYVPALELDNGQMLTEGAVIMQYVADQKPEAGLIPKQGTFERYRCQEWLNFISTEIHKSLSPLFAPDLPEPMKTNIRERVGKRLDWIVKEMGDSQFLMGAHFTVADAYLFTVLGWHRMVGLDMTKWPALMGYMERVRTRPAVVSAMKAEGLVK